MSPDLADATAIKTSLEVAQLITQAQLSVERAKEQVSPSSSSRAAALLKSLSLHLDEINLIASGGIEQENKLSALVVRHSHVAMR